MTTKGKGKQAALVLSLKYNLNSIKFKDSWLNVF